MHFTRFLLSAPPFPQHTHPSLPQHTHIQVPPEFSLHPLQQLLLVAWAVLHTPSSVGSPPGQPGEAEVPYLIQAGKVIQSTQKWLRYDQHLSDYVSLSQRHLPPSPRRLPPDTETLRGSRVPPPTLNNQIERSTKGLVGDWIPALRHSGLFRTGYITVVWCKKTKASASCGWCWVGQGGTPFSPLPFPPTHPPQPQQGPKASITLFLEKRWPGYPGPPGPLTGGGEGLAILQDLRERLAEFKPHMARDLPAFNTLADYYEAYVVKQAAERCAVLMPEDICHCELRLDGQQHRVQDHGAATEDDLLRLAYALPLKPSP